MPLGISLAVKGHPLRQVARQQGGGRLTRGSDMARYPMGTKGVVISTHMVCDLAVSLP